MNIEFDPGKNEANIAKHGVSLSAAANMVIYAVVADTRRNYGEPRFNAFGAIEGELYCLTFTPRGVVVRAISLRRSRAKEYRRYVL